MNCETLSELLGEYVNDSLPGEVRRNVESHLFGCAACAWEAQTQRITRERLREHAGGDVIASDAFRERVLSRLRVDNPHLATHADENAVNPVQYRLPIGV